jgi:UDP-N-acetylglucosamine 2-epimerase
LKLYDYLEKGKIITNNQFLYLNRLILIPPLDYIDLIHLQSKTYFIMTDSGGIQEEGV